MAPVLGAWEMVTTFIPDEVLLSNSDVNQNGIGNALLPTGAQTPTGIAPKEKRSKKGNEGWGWGDEGEVGKQSGQQSSSILPCVLRSSLPEQVRKTPLWGCRNPPTNHPSGLWLLSKKTENSRRVFYVVKIETSKNVTIFQLYRTIPLVSGPIRSCLCMDSPWNRPHW